MAKQVGKRVTAAAMPMDPMVPASEPRADALNFNGVPGGAKPLKTAEHPNRYSERQDWPAANHWKRAVLPVVQIQQLEKVKSAWDSKTGVSPTDMVRGA